MVTAVDRGRYRCLVAGAPITAMRARELGRHAIVVGDRVELVGDLSGAPGSLARIVRIGARRTVLRRTADDTDPTERVIVANADQVVVVASVADPPPRTGLIDRCLVAAFAGGLRPVICLTKVDLLAPDDPALARLRSGYAELGVTTVTSGDHAADPVPLACELRDRISVLVGHSGVGKSTLVNRLVPLAGRAVGEVTAVGRGRHTSSNAVALPLPGGGWIVDTPGVRSFGLAHVDPAQLLVAFADLAPGAETCPSGCDHGEQSPGCALPDWVAAGNSSAGRLASLRRLLASRAGSEP